MLKYQLINNEMKKMERRNKLKYNLFDYLFTVIFSDNLKRNSLIENRYIYCFRVECSLFHGMMHALIRSSEWCMQCSGMMHALISANIANSQKVHKLKWVSLLSMWIFTISACKHWRDWIYVVGFRWEIWVSVIWRLIHPCKKRRKCCSANLFIAFATVVCLFYIWQITLHFQFIVIFSLAI